MRLRAALSTAAIVLTLAMSCDNDPDVFYPPPPADLPDAFCCPSWFGTDSLVVYRDEGLADSDKRGLWITQLDGAMSQLILRGDVYTPSYSADRGELVYEAGTEILVAAVVNQAIDPVSIRQLTSNGSNFAPMWRQDGEWIAYDRRYCNFGGGGEDTTCGIFLIRPDASELRYVAKGVNPVWTPAGDALLYILRGEIYSVGIANGDTPTLLTNFHDLFDPPRAIYALSLSPDGLSVVVEVNTTPHPTIWHVPTGGGTPTQLFPGKWPSWSPSGRFIAFIARGNPDPLRNGTVWLYDWYAKQARQLTRR